MCRVLDLKGSSEPSLRVTQKRERIAAGARLARALLGTRAGFGVDKKNAHAPRPELLPELLQPWLVSRDTGTILREEDEYCELAFAHFPGEVVRSAVIAHKRDLLRKARWCAGRAAERGNRESHEGYPGARVTARKESAEGALDSQRIHHKKLQRKAPLMPAWGMWF